MPLSNNVINEVFTITKSDTTELPDTFIGFYVGGAGNVSILTPGGRTVVFTAPPVGTQIFCRARRILAATTATLLLGYLVA